MSGGFNGGLSSFSVAWTIIRKKFKVVCQNTTNDEEIQKQIY
jgi:hypothetical protein